MISPDDPLSLCGKIALQIENAFISVIDLDFGAGDLCIGADNTLIEFLDKIAGDISLDEFSKTFICKYALSEEVEEIILSPYDAPCSIPSDVTCGCCFLGANNLMNKSLSGLVASS